MTRSRQSDEQSVALRFGGGLNTRAYEMDVNDLEATEGQNFDLDPQNATLRPRRPFDFIGQLPNNEPVQGMGSLLKSDGTTQMFVQSGNRVYEWAPFNVEKDCRFDFEESESLTNELDSRAGVDIQSYETQDANASPQRIATTSINERAAFIFHNNIRTVEDIKFDRACVEIELVNLEDITDGGTFVDISDLAICFALYKSDSTYEGISGIKAEDFTGTGDIFLEDGDIVGLVVSVNGQVDVFVNGSFVRSGNATSNLNNRLYLVFSTQSQLIDPPGETTFDVNVVSQANEMTYFDSYNATDFCGRNEFSYTTEFIFIGSCDSNARLRGWLNQNWQLRDSVIVTDLAGREDVFEWNGDSDGFTRIGFQTSEGNDFGAFQAKYCAISNERALFANITDSTGEYPHLIVGSERGDLLTISTEDRPSSAIGEADPFFLVNPDLRPINGIVESSNMIAFSGREGSMFRMTGSSAEDFAIEELFSGSAASGDEPIVNTGNDIVYGRSGSISALSRAIELGDTEDVDLSVAIRNEIQLFSGWNLVYNSRTHKIYCFPEGGNEVWVAQKQMIGSELSPWTRFTTQHDLGFSPTVAMNLYDPRDGLEYIFMGDEDGNLYRLEGYLNQQDAGSEDIVVRRRSKMFSPPVDMRIVNGLEGWVTFKKKVEDVSVNLKLLFSGESIRDVTKTLTLTGLSGGNYYGGSTYYGGDGYYGIQFFDRSQRRRFQAAGGSTEFQVEIEVEGSNDFEIAEVGLRFLTQA